MARDVACSGGCGRTVRLRNGDAVGTCPACLAEHQRIARNVEAQRVQRALKALVRRGAVPRRLYQEVCG